MRMRIFSLDFYAPESWFTKVMPGLYSVGWCRLSLTIVESQLECSACYLKVAEGEPRS